MSDQSKKFSPAGEAGLAVRDIAWLYILKANYSTFPCNNQKQPLINGGFKAASTEHTIVENWERQLHPALWGIPCSSNGFFAVDIDPDGIGTWQGWLDTYGLPEPTPYQKTPRGGWHYLFRLPEGVKIPNTAGKLAKGIDLRSDGYICTGKGYEWQIPLSEPLAEAPEWLLAKIKALSAPKPAQKRELIPPVDNADLWLRKALEKAEIGKRNEVGFWLACQLRDAGLPQFEAEDYLTIYANGVPQDGTPYTESEALASVEQAYNRAPREPVALSKPDDYPLTDAGNAEFFAAREAGRICYRHDLQRWYVYKNPIWAADQDGEPERRALEAVRERQVNALAIEDIDKRKRALNFLLNCESDFRLRSLLNIAKITEPLAKGGTQFDQEDFLLATQNGVIDLQTGAFRAGQAGDYLTQITPIAYNPEAKAPRWTQFLSEIYQGDRELIAFVQRAVGYCLTGQTGEQVFFFCYGTGSNGKSVFLDALRALLGDYATNAKFATFVQEKTYSSHDDDLMALEGARLVTSAESKALGALADDVLKIITGGDPLTGSRKYEHTRTFLPKFKLWLAANHLPKVKDYTEAFWRRVILLPFNERFSGAQADKHLSAKLHRELSGILNWAIEGCLLYQEQGLNPPQRCADAVAAWRADNDVLIDFLDTCKVSDKAECKVGDLYHAYEDWCMANGQKAVYVNNFSQIVEAHGYKREKRRDGRYFIGIEA